jgi:hypothetical protein
MKPEYYEGPKAAANFENTLTTLFRAPKTIIKEPVNPPPKRKKASKG